MQFMFHFQNSLDNQDFIMCNLKVIKNAEANLFFFLIYLFIYLLAVLGLRCCVRAFSSCGERGLLFVVMRGLLIAVASLFVEHGL